jgi:hypothetical protein
MGQVFLRESCLFFVHSLLNQDAVRDYFREILCFAVMLHSFRACGKTVSGV